MANEKTSEERVKRLEKQIKKHSNNPQIVSRLTGKKAQYLPKDKKKK